MSNANHSNDEIKAPSRNLQSNGNQLTIKMHQLEGLLQAVKLAFEGFCLSQDYLDSEIMEHLQNEGCLQTDFYIQMFDELLLALNHFLEDMRNKNIANMEGK